MSAIAADRGSPAVVTDTDRLRHAIRWADHALAGRCDHIIALDAIRRLLGPLDPPQER